MLREMAVKGGTIPRPTAGKARATGQKRIEKIREKLRDHFKIEADPIPFNGATYKQVSRSSAVDPSRLSRHLEFSTAHSCKSSRRFPQQVQTLAGQWR